MRIIFFLAISLTLILCSTKKPDTTILKRPSPMTMLDSLQGVWMSDIDSSNYLIISGRKMTTKYVSSTIDSSVYGLYFSDTLMREFVYEANGIQIIAPIDTSLQRGKYILAISQIDSTLFCYKFHTFFVDSNKVGMTISDTWAKNRRQVFIKQ